MNRNKYIVMLLALLIIATGCEKSETIDTVDSEIVFEEKEISIESNYQILSLAKTQSGDYLSSYFDSTNETYHLGYTDPAFTEIIPIANDAGKLQSAVALTGVKDPSGMVTFGYQLVYDVDQYRNLYIVQYKTEKQNDWFNPFSKKVIFVYNQDGVLTKEIEVAESTQAVPMPVTKLIVQQNRVVLISDTGIQIVDNDGENLDELAVPSSKVANFIHDNEQVLPEGRITDADMVDEDQLVFIQDRLSHKYVIAYHLSDKQIVWEQKLMENFLPVKLQYQEAQDTIIIASSDKVITFGKDGTDNGEWIDFNQYESGAYLSAIFNGDNTLSPGYFLTEEPDMMYVYMIGKPLNPGIKKIYSYRTLFGEERETHLIERGKQKAEKSTVTMFVPFIEPALEGKIAQFEANNPEINVNLTYYRKDLSEFNPVDYLQYVSLQLFTNKSEWDVMAIQMLPYREYIQKGYFADMNQIDSEQWTKDREKFFTNILESVSTNDKLMLLPARILMHVQLADVEAAKPLQPFQYTWDDLIQLSNESTTEMKPWAFFGTNGYHFTSVFEEILNSYQYDIMAAKQGSEEQRQLLSRFLDTLKAISTPDAHAQSQQKPMFHLTPFFYPYFPNYIDAIGSEASLLPNPASPVSGKHSFTLQEGYSINANSESKEEALKLIAFLAEHAETNNIMFKHSFQAMQEQLGTTEQRKEAIVQLQAIVENLSVLRDLDHRIAEAIAHTAEQYISGVADKETAIRTIIDKLWLFDNE